MIHFDDSMSIIDSLKINKLKTKKLFLMDSMGYILAQDIVADHNSPELPTSAMDGYAVKHQDLKVGARIKIASINPAGSKLEDIVVGGVSIKTFTGALMPDGADTLIPIENVTVDGEEIVINDVVELGFAVRSVGENYEKNQKLISEGTTIDFAQIGVMASLNVVSVLVYDKPIVSIVSTGSELLELGEVQTNSSQIRSSNNYILEAIVNKYGGRALQLGCIKDDKVNIQNTISDALNKSDIVVTTGGVSVGDFDFVKDVIYELDCEVLFKGVRVKPGQHIMVARKGDKFIVGLPGFAYSSTVTALLYVLPLILKLQNSSSALKKVVAILDEPFNKRAKKAEFTACNAVIKNGVYHVDFEGKKVGSSAILTNMLGDIALMYTSEEDTSLNIGDEAKVVLL